MNKLISIVMAYYNRKMQLLHTLFTISQSNYHNFEVIIVNDASSIDESIDNIDLTNYSFKITIINIKKEEKTWINPCIAYNIGIKEAIGEIIVLQNPEVCHIGDCLSFVANNLKHMDWLSLNCYGLGNFIHNEELKRLKTNKDIYEFINKLDDSKIGGNSTFSKDVRGWLNHSQKHFVAYHYFAAIFKKDLVEKMNGGFCEEYKNGICYDDNDFIKYLIFNNFNFVSTEFSDNKPFVIHQYHTKPESLNFKNNYYINKRVFEKRMKNINANTKCDIHAGFIMPKPKLL